MAKFVQPNIIFDSSVSFLRNVTFDSSVYLQGVTHISNPASTSGTPYALVVDSVGADIQVKSMQLGTMATETASNYYTSSGTDSAIASAVGAVDTSLVTYTDGAIASAVGSVDSSLVSYVDVYNVIQDGSISRNTQKWVDSNRNGFLNQVETTLSFNDTTEVFTLGGTNWHYYLAGKKYTIASDVSVALSGVGPGASADRYYIYIANNTTGSLVSSTSVWDRESGQLPVAFIDWNSANSPKYWMGEERHTILIDTRMHKYLHNTRGTQFVSGGTLIGPDLGVAPYTGTTDASNALGVAATVIADEDIYNTLGAFTRPAVPSNDYVIFYRTGASAWSWKYEDTPLSENAGYIEYDNGSGMTASSDGKFVNTYLLFTNLAGDARYMILPGQGEFTTLAGAIDENFAAFDLSGLPIAEYVAAWQFTWEASVGLATRGKVALASTPVRIQVNSATASTPTTEAHNDLLGLQGGSASERYHLDLAQYNDYIGKTDVDSSLSTIWTKFGNVDTSLNNLGIKNAAQDASIIALRLKDTQQDASIVALRLKDTQQDASIIRIDSSIGTLNGLINTNIANIDFIETSLGTLNGLINTNTANISTNTTDIGNIETSLGTLNGLINTNTGDITNIESSLGVLNTWNINQDISIANISSAQGNYVSKAGDTMSGPLTISAGGLSVANDVSISGGLLVSGSNGLIVTNDAFIGGSLTIDGSLYVTNVETIDVSAAYIHLNTGLTGTPPPTMQSGLVIGRGSEEPYVFLFDETLDTFRIGIATETSTGYLDPSTQAVATREDAPVSYGVGYWNSTDFQIETSVGFTFTPGTGLGLPIAANMASEATALVWNGTTVGSRELGSNAFDSSVYVLKSLFDSSVGAIWTKFGYVDTSLGTLNGLINTNIANIDFVETSLGTLNGLINTNIANIDFIETSLGTLNGLINTNTADIANVETSLGTLNGLINTNTSNITTNTADIAQLDASIIRIDASLNDVIDILSLGFTTDVSVNAAFALRDTSIAWLNTNKLNLSGGTMTGLLTLAAAGFTLDSQNITDIDTSALGLGVGLDTHIPTSAAVKSLVDSAISAGVTASNGLTEFSGDIQLGGTLSKNTSIDISTYNLLFGNTDVSVRIGTTDNNVKGLQVFAGDVFSTGTSVLAVDASELVIGHTAPAGSRFDNLRFNNSGVVFTNQIPGPGQTGIQYGGNYDSTLTADSLIPKRVLTTAIGNIDGSLVTYVNTAIGAVDTSLVAYTNAAVNGVDASLVAYTNTAIGAVDTSLVNYTNSAVGAVDSSLVAFTNSAVGAVDSSLAAFTNSAVNGVDASAHTYVGAVDSSLVTYTNSAVGAVDSSLVAFTNSAVGAVDSSLVSYVDGKAVTIGASNGLQVLADGSVGLGGTLTFVGDTSITTSASNTLSFGGLITSTSDNSYALVQNVPAGPIKTRQLGNMAWAATSTYRTSTDIDTSLALYVKKAGDTMTGALNITGGGLQVGQIGNQYDVSIYGGLYVHNGATIGGDLYVDGSLYVTNVHTIDVSAGFIRLNTGMTGTPPASMQSGIAVERGDLEPYVFIFDESTQDFRIGIAVETSTGFLDASTQAVATREDTPTDTAVPFWNAAENRFDTDAGFFFDKTNGLQVDVSITGLGITLSDLQNQATEATSLMIDTDGVVGTRELGTNAFSSASYVLQSLFDTSITAIWTKFGNVDTSLNNIWTKLGSVDTSLNNIWTKFGSVDTSLNNLGIKNAAQDASIVNLRAYANDLSTNKLDGVASTTGVAGVEIYAGEDANHVAYIKRLVAGAGATITSTDGSTISISVTGSAGYVSKYAGTFDGTAASPFVITAATHSLGTGPLSVTVWESGAVVYTGVDVNGSNDVTLSWSAGSLVDASCKFLITG